MNEKNEQAVPDPAGTNEAPPNSKVNTSSDDSNTGSAVVQAAGLAGFHPSVKHPQEDAKRNPYRKKWMDYLFEFFMLFLAITLGFFVENKRESLKDGKKVKAYVRTLVEDLKTDTVKINYEVYRNGLLINGLDSLENQLYNFSYAGPGSIPELYNWYIYYGRNTYTVYFTDRTFTHLTYSDNMRLLPQPVSDSLVAYQDGVKLTRANEHTYLDYWTKSLDYSLNIFDYRYIRSNRAGAVPVSTYTLLTYEPAVLNKYAALLELWRQVVSGYVQSLLYQKARAINLAAFLKKEYRLD